jgi:DNA-binding response OmpR family regulator
MSKKVMIVDDDYHIRLAVSKLLGRSGIEVCEADSGQSCLNEMEMGFQGLILMDVMMPEMNGWQTVRNIVERGYYDGSLIFMLTALETPDERIEDLQSYVVDYLTKPFEPEELVSTCQTYLEYLERG